MPAELCSHVLPVCVSVVGPARGPARTVARLSASIADLSLRRLSPWLFTSFFPESGEAFSGGTESVAGLACGVLESEVEEVLIVLVSRE